MVALVVALVAGTTFAWFYEKDPTPTEIIDPANNSDPIEEIITEKIYLARLPR